MKIRYLAVAVMLIAGLPVPLAQAENARPDRHHARQNFTTDVTRTTGSGKTMSRHTEQVVTDTGFRRESTFTNLQGKTASRSVEGSYDPDSRTFTKNIVATGFNGETHSTTVVRTRTAAGAQ